MIEEKKNLLNFEIRALLTIVDMIDGVNNKYPDYAKNRLTEEEFLDQQTMLVREARERLSSIFKN